MPLLESIREEVRERLTELGAERGQLAETCLLQNSAYCGRRFMMGGFQAVWFLEEDQVKYYGAQGELLGSERIGREIHRMPRALPKAA